MEHPPARTFTHETAMRIEVVPADTTPEAARVQFEIYRRMQPSRRLEIALEMNTTMRELVAAGVRCRHPDYSAEQVRLAVIRLCLGEEWFRKVYPGVNVEP
jgi:hypothetical protein